MQTVQTTSGSPALSPWQKVKYEKRWHSRHVLFKAGVYLLVFSAVCFTIGFSAPAWESETGLWMICDFGTCYHYADSSAPDWLNAVRAMECLALISYVFSIAMELIQDCRPMSKLTKRESRVVEILAFAGGFLTLIAVAIFGARNQPGWNVETYNRYNGTTWQHEVKLHWGYGITVSSCILGVISASLILVSRIIHSSFTAARHSASSYTVTRTGIPMHSFPYTVPLPSAANSAHGVTASQIPVFYVLNQGSMVPVYAGTPSSSGTVTITSSSSHHAGNIPTNGYKL